MLTKRIIPCLDIKDGRTVKGVNFVNIRDAGDPVELGAAYAEQGADELVFLDISATNEDRKTFATLVKDIARHINIPFTVGGGISSVADVAPLLDTGVTGWSVRFGLDQNCVAIAVDKVAQKVGEEAVELVIESKDDNRDLFLGEAADLMYHYLVLLTAKGFSLSDVVSVLQKRHK